MPQIKVNEIDQSIVTRVVSDNKVKVLVPGIASFGPAYDSTNISAMTFTDVNEFNKVFGYTEAEYNPIENDYSRIYATELIKKGAEVSFIRINNGGDVAKFDIGPADRTTPSKSTVIDAVKYSDAFKEEEAKANGAELSDYSKYTFLPQIESITAKYSGSFGNKLLLTITPITSKNIAYNYQYANISIYYVDSTTNYKINTDESTGESTVTKDVVVNRVKKLETHRVSTNPSDADYFEDVEFNYITITATANARNELTLAWSTLDPVSGTTTLSSGFPQITLKIHNDENALVYNNFANLSGGTDFEYSESSLSILQKGYSGVFVGGGAGFNVDDVNTYINDVYGESGILSNIFATLNECYENFTDPYIYDFDFITSGGLLNIDYEVVPGTDGNMSTVTATGIIDGNTVLTKLIPVHDRMRELVETRQDCIALCDVYKEYHPESAPEYVRLLNSSYCTVHNPWCWINHPSENRLILMPPSFIFLHTLLSNLINNIESQKWFPPAGVKRATARVVKKPMYEIGSTLLNAWQNDSTSRVNPIMKLKQFGYVIYGQYTALEALDEYTHSALESLNVRLISNVVKKKIFEVCMQLAFEPNTKSLWLKFFAHMDKFLSYMKNNDGLYDYKIVMDESTVTSDDINELRCPGKVYIAPTRTAEFFDIDFIITNAGVTFGTDEGDE